MEFHGKNGKKIVVGTFVKDYENNYFAWWQFKEGVVIQKITKTEFEYTRESEWIIKLEQERVLVYYNTWDLYPLFKGTLWEYSVWMYHIDSENFLRKDVIEIITKYWHIKWHQIIEDWKFYFKRN